MSESSQHVPVLLAEAVDALNVKPDGVYVDATFGRGGHSQAILARLGKQGRLIVFDKDPTAIETARAMQDARLTVIHAGFAQLSAALREIGVVKVDGVLLDLGVSSPQLNEASRGFSFRMPGPLDMRMDTTRGRTAAEWLAKVEERELAEVIANYGEERFAKQIARAIVAARAGGPIDSTRLLSKIVAEVIPTYEPGQNPATRTFQAIRIYINQELEELSLVLPQCVALLTPGGRMAVISFHSLEDRIVKRFLKSEAQPDQLPSKFPIKAADLPQPRMKPVGKAKRPSAAECAANPRARSAVLRVAERTEVAL
ncbi:MAG: 16S rRNA (cytosine(1402)-N(4))-methyltransferase RsmH [Hydrogenophilales bacterium]|nr:16S rRNA (cytosine(1402)-N(4))-methyltransferase RsmH [Hydrogenophilales bacterium]